MAKKDEASQAPEDDKNTEAEAPQEPVYSGVLEKDYPQGVGNNPPGPEVKDPEFDDEGDGKPYGQK